MARHQTVTRKVAFTQLDPSDDWRAIGRISATLSWSSRNPCVTTLSFPKHEPLLLFRRLLFDALACHKPEGVGDGTSHHWTSWDTVHILLELGPYPHAHAILRARKSALIAFLAATTYHELSNTSILDLWYSR